MWITISIIVTILLVIGIIVGVVMSMSSSPKMTNIDFESLIHHYNVESFNENKWQDLVTKTNAKITGELVKVSEEETDELDDFNFDDFETESETKSEPKKLKLKTYLKGTTQTKIDLNMKIEEPNNWTMVFVTRYDPNGKARARILQGKSNTLFGHWNNEVGTSFQRGWIHRGPRDNNTRWLLSIHQHQKIYNKLEDSDEWKVFEKSVQGVSENEPLYINDGGHTRELSDFNISEVRLYNKTLDDDEIEKVKKYFDEKYY